MDEKTVKEEVAESITQNSVGTVASAIIAGMMVPDEETGRSVGTKKVLEGGEAALDKVPGITEEDKTAIIDNALSEVGATLHVSPEGIDAETASLASALLGVSGVVDDLSLENSQIGAFWDSLEAGTFQGLFNNVVSSMEQYNASHQDATKTLTNVKDYYQLQEMQIARQVSQLGTPSQYGSMGVKGELK